jgi:glycosyltransferase involved in cell wall biosynthesis
MRVAHFLLGRCNPESANGIDKTVYYVSQHEARLGHDVALFSISDLPPIPVPGVDVNVYRPRWVQLAKRASWLRDALERSPFNLPRALVSDLLEWSPDIVHIHFVRMPQAIRLSRRLTRMGIPYCVSLHGGLATEGQQRRTVAKKMFTLVLERKHLNRAAFLHAVTRAEAQGTQAYRVKNRIIVAPNCIDVGILPPRVESDLLTRRLPQAQGRRVFMYLGRLDPEQKGLDLLLHAWSEMRNRHDMGLVLIGPDWRGGQSQLRTLARNLGLADCVFFVGRVSGAERWSLLAGADLFVHPSRWEAGVPFAVLEAMLAGKPVLLTDPADPERLISRYEAGLDCPVNVTSLAESLQAAAALEPADLKAMGLNARRLIDEEFRWEQTARKLLRASRDAIGPPRVLA